MDNLILVGFSCSGKTTLGRNVARRLRLSFVDTDRCIEEMTGRTIPDIFREDGEAAFRALEREAISRIMAEQNQVVSTGGGAFVDPRESRADCATATWSSTCRSAGNGRRPPAQQQVGPAAAAARQPRPAGAGHPADGRAQRGLLGRARDHRRRRPLAVRAGGRAAPPLAGLAARASHTRTRRRAARMPALDDGRP